MAGVRVPFLLLLIYFLGFVFISPASPQNLENPPAHLTEQRKDFVYVGTVKEFEGFAISDPKSARKEKSVWGNARVKEISEKNYPRPGETVDFRWSEKIFSMRKMTVLQREGQLLIPKQITIPEEKPIPMSVQGSVTRSEFFRDQKTQEATLKIGLDQNDDQKEETEVQLIFGSGGKLTLSVSPT